MVLAVGCWHTTTNIRALVMACWVLLVLLGCDSSDGFMTTTTKVSGCFSTALDAKKPKAKKKNNKKSAVVATGASGFGRAAGTWDGCESLRTWLRSSAHEGVDVDGITVGVVDGLRGVTAARDFQRGEVLFAIPRATGIVDEDKADASPLARVLYPTAYDRQRLAPPIRVALFLLRLEQAPAAAERALWEPALAALPTVTDFAAGGGPMQMWSTEEVAKVECGQMIAEVQDRKDKLRVLYDDMIYPRWTTAAMDSDTELYEIPPPSFEALQHAVCVVTSRNFGQGDTDGGSSSMLVPGVDLCNHDDPALVNTKHALSPWGSFVVLATQRIRAGDQVLISYGPLPNRLLLAQFGFMLLDRDTPLVSDTALVRVDGLFSVDNHSNNNVDINIAGAYTPATAASEAAAELAWCAGPGPSILAPLKACNRGALNRVSRWQPASSAREAATLVARHRQKNQPPTEDDGSLSGQDSAAAVGKDLYRGLLERELASYSRTLAQDEMELANLTAEDPLPIHAWLALRFRIQAKRMLGTELELLQVTK